METFTLSLITPEAIAVSESVRMVTAPGTEGEFGVLPGHMPFITTLKPGIITVEKEDGSVERFVVRDGLAEVTPEKCVILAETAKNLAGTTRTDVEAEIARAKELLEDAGDNEIKRKDAEKRIAAAEAALTLV